MLHLVGMFTALLRNLRRLLACLAMAGCTLLFQSATSSAQICKGNINTGCSNPGAACSPVTQGTGTSGHCQTGPQPKGEKECDCVGQPIPPEPIYPNPFDIFSQGTDANGFLLNPVWLGQLHTAPGPPSLANPPFKPAYCPFGDPWTNKCTTWHPHQIAQDDTTRLVCGFGSREFKGGKGEYHFNWTQSTYEGQVWYDELADDDNDVNFVLYRPDNAGTTVFDSRGLQLEFDSSETVAHFNSSWWKNFWNAAQKERAVRGNDDASPQQKQQAHDAAARLLRRPDGTPIEGIASGWLGLDCVHNCGPEIHPVFSLALHVKEDPNDDVWVFFVRNNGNEGYCSEGSLYAPQFNDFSFTLPWRLRTGTNPKIPLPVTDAFGSVELISFDGNAFSFSPDAVDVSTQAQPGTGITIKVTSNVPVMSKPDPLLGYIKRRILGRVRASFPLDRQPASQRPFSRAAERNSGCANSVAGETQRGGASRSGGRGARKS